MLELSAAFCSTSTYKSEKRGNQGKKHKGLLIKQIYSSTEHAYLFFHTKSCLFANRQLFV